MKNTNQQSRMDPHNRNDTENYREVAQPERSKQHGKHATHKHGIMLNQV